MTHKHTFTFSALGLFHIMRYINVRYLLTYLLICYQLASKQPI